MDNFELPAPVDPAQQPHKPLKPPKYRRRRRVFPVFLTLLLMTTTALGVWYVMEFKLNTTRQTSSDAPAEIEALKARQQAAQNKLAEAEKKIEELQAGQKVTDDIATGPTYPHPDDPLAVIVNVHAKPGTVQEIWVEFGTDPNNLEKQTVHMTEGLAAGDGEVYAAYPVTIPSTELTPGQAYFYRAAAGQDGERIFGGIALFTTPK